MLLIGINVGVLKIIVTFLKITAYINLLKIRYDNE